MMTVWKLRQGADRRIRSGHPWVFSNELSASPKGHKPGAPVILQDFSGKFVAAGYGNPHSLIAFRALSFDPRYQNVEDQEFLISKILKAWSQRKLMGFKNSFRMVFGESDFIPGLIIDLYKLESSQVLCVQVLTAGIDALIGTDAERFFKKLMEDAESFKISELGWEKTGIVLRNDVNIRRLEGLEVPEAKVLKEIPGVDLKEVEILIEDLSASGIEQGVAVKMSCDLIEGQKTGFFLDQTWNIKITIEKLKSVPFKEQTVRVLDLCCYNGHWSTQLTRFLTKAGYKVETTIVDVSDAALKLAAKNAAKEGAVVIPQKLDVMTGLNTLPERHYDIVIADPPAFIKAKKDVPTGKAAYLKMNTFAFKLVRKGGFVVSCSCSGNFEKEEMKDVLRKSIQRSEIEARCLAEGGHAADHPTSMTFSEGHYLKMFLHHVL